MARGNNYYLIFYHRVGEKVSQQNPFLACPRHYSKLEQWLACPVAGKAGTSCIFASKHSLFVHWPQGYRQANAMNARQKPHLLLVKAGNNTKNMHQSYDICPDAQWHTLIRGVGSFRPKLTRHCSRAFKERRARTTSSESRAVFFFLSWQERE